MGGRRRCCCSGQSCIIFEDAFNRLNNTNLGAGWYEANGNSDIFSSTLRVPSGGRVTCTRPNPLSTPATRTTAVLKNPQSGDVFRACLNSDREGLNCLFAEFEAMGGGQAWIRACSLSNGIVTLLDQNQVGYTAGLDNNLVACRTLTGLYAGCDASMTTWACIADDDYRNVYRRAGLANGGNTSIQFDNFQYMQYEYPPGTICFACACECDDGVDKRCMPKQLTLTITVVLGGMCDCLDGETVTLNFVDGNQPAISWSGTGNFCTWNGGAPEPWAFTLWCDGPFILCLAENQSSICGWNPPGDGPCTVVPPQVSASPSSVQCDPLEIVYTGFLCTGSPPPPDPTCRFTITITE